MSDNLKEKHLKIEKKYKMDGEQLIASLRYDYVEKIRKEVCGCGNLGCMEELAGGKYLARICESEFNDTHISEMFLKHNNHPLIQEFIDRMACALATEINILNPNTIIIGGGIINMEGFPKDYYLEKLKQHTRKPHPCNNLNLIFTNDDEMAGVIGSCLYVKNRNE